MTFRINHYASKVLDSSGTVEGELIACYMLMSIMLLGFSIMLFRVGYTVGAGLFAAAAILIVFCLLSSIILVIRSTFGKTKAKSEAKIEDA